MPPLIVSSVNSLFLRCDCLRYSFCVYWHICYQSTPLRLSDLNKYAIDNECENNPYPSNRASYVRTTHRLNSLHSLEIGSVGVPGGSDIDCLDEIVCESLFF